MKSAGKIFEMTFLFFFSFSILLAGLSASAAPAPRQYFELKVYHLKTEQQQQTVEQFLQTAYLPALHRAGIATVGVFRPIEDTGTDKRIYVLIPFHSLEQFAGLPAILQKDARFQREGTAYLEASPKDPPYERIETILLRAFPGMPQLQVPDLKAPKNERVYELRSYESATEKMNLQKVKMFNEGGEIKLFKRLNFHAAFYSEVISGSRMPNLMYMTTFENRQERDAHWKAFGSDPEWKKLSALPEYQNTVSHIDDNFLRPADYSDL